MKGSKNEKMGMQLIKPKALSAGDRVALVSLSSGIAGEETFAHRVWIGKKRLEEEFGLQVTIMPNAMKGLAFLDQNPKARADDLMAAFKNPDIKAVISMIGGDDTIRILPFIDYSVFRDHPKIFMGYSDTTINHFMMHKAGLVSFYGPSVFAEFAENGAMHEYTKRHIRQTLFEKHDIMKIEPSEQWTSEFLDWADPNNNEIPRRMLQDAKGYELLQGSGRVQGRLLGGCADVFSMAIGTELWPERKRWKDAILFLETSEECPTPSTVKYLLRGMMAQGLFEAISGVVFGKPKDEEHYEAYKEVLLQVIGREAGRSQMPILYNLNFGHTAPMCILPYGIMAEINCREKSFRLLESPVQ